MSLVSETNIAARSTRLVEALAGPSVDLILVTELVNVRYLTGYTGSNGLALIGADTRVFITDFRYAEQAAVEVDPSFERIQTTTAIELVDELPGVLGAGSLKLGFDVTLSGEVIGADGSPTPGLYALGPITKGAKWEITAVPDIRRDCARLADRMARQASPGRSPATGASQLVD